MIQECILWFLGIKERLLFLVSKFCTRSQKKNIYKVTKSNFLVLLQEYDKECNIF